MKKICIVTGTRAEYGLLYWLLKEIENEPTLKLQLIATGMHLSPEFGLTYKVIEEDGFTINEKLELLLSSDTPVGIAKSIGLGTIGFAEIFERLKPDILVLLGDRYEILAAAQAALIARIPVAHIAGGDTTEGAFDEAIRHSITKMSHLHFVTNELSAKRVRQMGENPKYIFNVGSPGIDTIIRLKKITREELENKLNFKFKTKNLLITYHPATLDSQSPAEGFRSLIQALHKFGPDFGLIFTKTNSDTGGRVINHMIDEYVESNDNAKAYTSLGQFLYLNTISHVDAVVGNSSSGLYEVPSFKKPTVNIGIRQQGRLQAPSIINCNTETDSISQAIQKALVMDCSDVVNPYGHGNSSKKIMEIIKGISDPAGLLKKHFFEMVPAE